MGRTKLYVQFRGRFEASINSLSLLFVWDFHACPSVCVEKDSKKPRPLKITCFHQFLPKLETHLNQFPPRYMVVLNMERVVIKKPNRMELVPLGESEPPNLQLFPPYRSQGLTTGKWNSLQEVQKLPFTNYWSCLSWLYWLSSLSWLSCAFCLDCVLCLFCLSWQKTKIQTHEIEVKKFGSFCNLFWFIGISVFLFTDYLISPLSDCQ